MAEHNPFPGENNTGHIWDDNLRELSNPPPRWWMLAFWASIIWWVAYGLIYPMWPTLDGYTKGLTGWTSMKEYQQGLDEIEAVRAQYEEQLQGMSAADILKDDGLSTYTVASAKVLFGDYCAACHGSGGQGNPGVSAESAGFPVLADDDWLYGGSIEKIVETITLGRKGVMTAHGKILNEQEVSDLASYVVALSEGKETADMTAPSPGYNLFMQKGCIACHGMDGKGMQMLGSANLTDAIWRFEPGGLESAEYTIQYGVNDPTEPKAREAVMPSFKDRLSEDEIKKLAVYVYKFGGGQ